MIDHENDDEGDVEGEEMEDQLNVFIARIRRAFDQQKNQESIVGQFARHSEVNILDVQSYLLRWLCIYVSMCLCM